MTVEFFVIQTKNMEYEYWNEEKREWVGLVKMHYHSIKDGRVFMYCNWYAVREVPNSGLNDERSVATADAQ